MLCPECGEYTEVLSVEAVSILAKLKQPCDFEMITCKCSKSQFILCARKTHARTQDPLPV